MTVPKIIAEFEKHRNDTNIEGMARFGIDSSNAFGIKLPILRAIAKPYKKNHTLALELWKTGYHEARLMAIFIDDPKLLTVEQMESWMKDFNSWDIVDQACSHLFCKHPEAYDKVIEWAQLEPEYERRTAFALLAMLAVHDKKAPDEKFLNLFPIIELYTFDNRNFVRKAVNWALRQIGKRNELLNLAAIACAKRIKEQNSKAGNWIANDALRELMGDAVQRKVAKG
jgi:3-methyladenine DNA glycosylase AlkD